MEIIAYYLPQYYPFKENNEWWGEGFTEWTNVGKASKRYPGHYQPKVPKDLGYYDLRLVDNQNKQIELAKEAGVTAFCYWHYWFGNGKRLLDKPIASVLKNKELDFPFCFGWANESWMAKIWSTNGVKGKTLIEQEYPGINDIINHYEYVKQFILDNRYLRINNKPVFVIYKPFLIPDLDLFMRTWNNKISEDGIADSFFFIAHTLDESEINILLSKGFDAVNIVRVGAYRYDSDYIKKIPLNLFIYKLLKCPLILKYSSISKYFIKQRDYEEDVIPTIIPNWDHTPRSGNRGVVFHNSTPNLFKKHVMKAFEAIKNKPKDKQVLFLKSWNEWGEGNYMEPDLKYGKQYIENLRECKNAVFE